MIGQINIVLVYLGSKIPQYVIDNLELISENFQAHQVVLLVDNAKDDQVKSLKDIRVVRVTSPDILWSNLREKFGYSKDFRNDFWFKTVSRFQALATFMASNPDDRLLHVEADVWLSRKFPIHFFDKLDYDFAYPLTNENQGVASTLYVKDYASMQDFISYIEIKFLEDPYSTDVSILGSFHSDFPDKVFILPTIPDPRFPHNEHASNATRELMSKNFDLTKGIFDASTWGQFFTGHDPENFVGITRIFVHQEHHAVSTKGVQTKYTEECGPSLVYETKVIPFYSLHIHSKNRTFFSRQFTEIELDNVFNSDMNRVKYRIHVKRFLELLPGFILYHGKNFVKKMMDLDSR